MAQIPMRGMRVPDDLWGRVKAAADARGLSVSEWVREQLEAATTRA